MSIAAHPEKMNGDTTTQVPGYNDPASPAGTKVQVNATFGASPRQTATATQGGTSS
jgi:hypothetical protein